MNAQDFDAHAALGDTEFGFRQMHRIMPAGCTGSCVTRPCDCTADVPERGHEIPPGLAVRFYLWTLNQPDWSGFWIAVGIVVALVAFFVAGPWL